MILLLALLGLALAIFVAMMVIIFGAGLIEGRLPPEEQRRPPRHEPR